MNGKTELRKLPAGHLYRLAEILEVGQQWKKLMSIIPRTDGEGANSLKYRMEHIVLIERASITQRRSCGEIFLEEWSTSGRKRPDLEMLLELLLKANLIRAAEFVAIDLLGGEAPSRPTTGPSANVDLSDEAIEELSRLLEKQLEDMKKLHQLQEAPSPVQDLFVAGPFVPPSAEGVVPTLRLEEEGRAEMMPSRESNKTEANTNERLLQIQETIEIESLHFHHHRGDDQERHRPSFDTKLPHFPHADLERFTANFCDIPLSDPGDQGRKLGTGAFGSVYLGILPMLQKVAVKKLNRDAVNLEKQFRNEVEALSKFHHPNLLPLLGYSCDGPNYCLVYEYMCNGSLQERLTLKHTTCSVLPWWQRISIGLGTAKGIFHLHSAFEKPLIHRDVKTANILLDENLQPKLGDFGLVRLGSNGQRSQSIALTTTVFGTSAYMAREAFRGDISVKIDTYSFGVVLLELLTGLPPFDDQRDKGHDLVTYVETVCEESILPILDKVAGDWGSPAIIDQLFSLSLSCLEDKRKRPVMSDVVQCLHTIVDMSSNCV